MPTDRSHLFSHWKLNSLILKQNMKKNPLEAAKAVTDATQHQL